MRVIPAVLCLPLAFLAMMTSATGSLGANALGPRIGIVGSDEVFLGVQGEFGPAIGPATIVPSIDFGIGDGPATTANLDLRFYLIPLPETGIRFYGAAGPSIVFRDGSDLGLSLTLGLHIPMKKQRRYNLEYRWGIGDLPDHKIGFAVMFGL